VRLADYWIIIYTEYEWLRPAFLKLWSSGSALVVLLDWTLVQKRQRKWSPLEKSLRNAGLDPSVRNTFVITAAVSILRFSAADLWDSSTNTIPNSQQGRINDTFLMLIIPHNGTILLIYKTNTSNIVHIEIQFLIFSYVYRQPPAIIRV
jgi:hypothetical protein